MQLHRPRENSRAFDVFLCALGALGVFGIWLGLSFGGFGYVLAGIAGLCELALIYGVWIEPRRLSVKIYEESLSVHPTTKVRLIFASDFHAGDLREKTWFDRVAREIQALKPDLLILGGDFVADRSSALPKLSALADLRAVLGRYFILGNHDFLDNADTVRREMLKMGYEDLRNRSIIFERERKKLEIQGLDDHWYGNPAEVKRMSKETPHVTISHGPDVMLDLEAGDTDLVICGHSHAGQVRFPFIGGVLPIPTILGKTLYRGREMMNGTRCIISNGLGESALRMRLLAPPQIVVVEVGI